MYRNMYEKKILDAIQTLVDNAIDKASFDKTIKGIISKCVDEKNGKYVVIYQDSSFYAYSNDTSQIYSAGTPVYVLIPRGDMTQTKTIIGSVNKLGSDYINTMEEITKYDIIGNSIVEMNSEAGVCSYTDGGDAIVLYDKTDVSHALVTIDAVAASTYIKQAKYLALGGSFRTNLNKEQQYSGNYGLGFDLNFTDNMTGETVKRTYLINVNNMTGNPYKYTKASEQKIVFNIDGANFVDVDKIYLYCYDFPNIATGKPDDIFVSNLIMEAANELTQDELAGNKLTLITPQGIYFDNTITANKIINTEVMIDNKIVNADSSSLKYYWFKENYSIDSSSLLYHRYGGVNWECLNNYNIVEKDNNDNPILIDWITNQSSLNIAKSTITARTVDYKCVVVYNNEIILTKQLTIYNYSNNNVIEITSDSGTYFSYDNGHPTLTCAVTPIGTYTYKWYIVDAAGVYTRIPETTQANIEYATTLNRFNELQTGLANGTIVLTADIQTEFDTLKITLQNYNDKIERIDGNTIYNLRLNRITNFATFVCTVENNGTYLGKGSIKIENDLNTSDNSYTLIINHGDQVFKYNNDGISPCSKSLDDPQELYPLSFVLYDEKGNEINNDIINAKDVFWTVPTSDTMIKVSSVHGNPIRIDNVNETATYTQYKEFYFEIPVLYNGNKNRNTIELSVRYKNKIVKARTELLFIKEGESGSNGTDFVCRIIPNVAENVLPPLYPTVTYDGTTTSLNYNPITANIWFRAQLYHNGSEIFNSATTGTTTENKTVTVKWEILKNKYDATHSDVSNFTVNSNTGAFAFDNLNNVTDATLKANPSNIVKCTLTYEGVDYIATMPIILVRVYNSNNKTYSIDLNENTGFRYAMYTTDGRYPIYDNSNPFALKVTQTIEGTEQDISTTTLEDYIVDYHWSENAKGIYYTNTWITQSNLVLDTLRSRNLNRNEKYYKPIDKFNGLCVSNALYCEIEQDNTLIGSIHIPVHMYLNRYGQSALNGWDGNHIAIDNDGGFILAPQIGAGKKEQDNSYTGIFMGSVQEAGSNAETGLFAYNSGERTIELNAADGSAKFGKSSAGQINISPGVGDDKGTAKIYSSDYEVIYTNPSDIGQTKYSGGYSYWRKVSNTEYRLLREGVDYQIGATIAGTDYIWGGGTGLEIDLNDPHIRFGSGKFRVDSDGQVYATGFVTVSNLENGDYDIPGTEKFKVDYATDTVQIETNTNHYPSSNITKTITCKCYYKDVITSSYTATLVNSSGNPIANNTITSGGLTVTVSKSSANTTITFTAQSSTQITNAINEYFVKFDYSNQTGLTTTKVFYANLVIKGADGRSITSATIRYQGGDSATTPPSNESGWVENPPVVDPGKYLWTRTVFAYSSGSPATSTTYSVAYMGTDGEDGENGQPGQSSYTYIRYSINSDGNPMTTTPSSDSKYIGICISNSSTAPTTYSSYTWSKYVGTGISSTVISYAQSNQGTSGSSVTGWQSSIPSVDPGKYLWTRAVMTYTDNTSKTSYSVTRMGLNGQDGAQGPVGPPGADGTSVTIKGSYTSLNDLIAAHPSGNTLGDGYIIDLDLYIYTNSAGGSGSLAGDWEDVGQFKGFDAKMCFITATTEVFKSTDAGATFTPSTTVITPTFQAVSYSSWSYSINGGSSFTTLTGSEAGISINSTTKALTVQNNFSGFNSNSVLIFKCTSDGTDDNNKPIEDTITITRIQDGEDAINVILTNENQTIAGTTSSAIATTISTDVVAYKGTTQKATIVGSSASATTINTGITGITATINNNNTTNASVTFTITTNLTQKTGEITVPVTVDEVTINKKFSFSLSLTGKGISSVVEYYAINNSNSTPPADSSFSTTFVSPTSSNKYLWNYEQITYTDSSVISTSKRVIGNYSKNGTNGISITGVTNKYQVSTSNTTAPTTWLDTPPQLTSTNKYLWNYEIVSYSSGSPTETTPCVIGAYGDKGDSVTISSQEIKYGFNDSGVDYSDIPATRSSQNPGGWDTSIPNTPDGKYLWTRTTVNYSDGSSTISYSVSYQSVDGEDATQYYTHVMYATSSSGANISSNPSGKTYVGIRVDTTQTASTTPSDYTWTKFVGDNGSNGADATQYYTYIRYSQNSNGSNYVETPTSATKYIGVCVVTTTTPPAYNNSAWKWSLYAATQYYTYVRYASSATPAAADISTSSTGKSYIGVAVVTSSTAPTTYTSYTWTKFVGEDGSAGTNSYTYIRYSANADGSNMVETPTSLTKYVGIYAGSSSTVPAYTAFTWSKYAGDDAIQYYTYVRYASSATPDTSDISQDSTGKKYVGIAITTSTTAPTVYTDYTWSKFIGEDGFSVWTTTTAPSSSKINISALTGPTGVTPRIGEHIIRSNRYQYTITAVSSTQVTVGSATDLKGKDGNNGTSIIWKGDLSSAPSNPENLWAYYNTTDKKSYIYNGSSWTMMATDGTNATQYYYHVVYCNNTSSGSGYSTTPSNQLYTGTYVDTNQADAQSWSSLPSGVKWNYTKGDTGESATNIVCGNEAQSIVCGSDGKVTAATTITIPFAGYIGNNRAACSVTYSTLPSGMTLTSNTAATTSADGSLVLAVAANATLGNVNDGIITLTFTCNSKTFTKKFSWTKSLKGDIGTSVDSITEQYYLSTSKTSQTGGSWVETAPTWESGKYIWTRSKIVYSNPTSTVYTTPLCSSEWEAINDVQIGGKNLIYRTREFAIPSGTSTLLDEYYDGLRVREQSTLGTTSSWKDLVKYDNLQTRYGMIFNAGDIYTLSCYIRIVETDEGADNRLLAFFHGNTGYATVKVLKSSNGYVGSSYGNGQIDLNYNNYLADNQWHRIFVTWQINPSATDEQLAVSKHLYIGRNYFGKKIQLCGVKFEKGDKATDWTPAPEDEIQSLDVEYYLSTSATSVTGGSWSTTAPEWVNGKYMWSRQKITYGNGTIETKNQTCIAGAKGDNGENAKVLNISPSAQVFKSTTGASGTFTPQYIYLYPDFQNVTYSKWQYSTNGTTWTDVTSGSNSLTIGTYNSKANSLRIERNCNLFSSSVTSLSFKCLSNDANTYDITSVTKIWDGVNGATPYIAYLTNESQTFAYGTAATVTTQLYAYQGIVEKAVQIKSVNGVTATTTQTATGLTGMEFKVSSTSAVSHPTISFISTTSLAQTQTAQVPIVYSISGENVDKTIYFSYGSTTKGSTGTAARIYNIDSNSYSVVKGVDGTLSPSSITFSAYYRSGTGSAKTAYSGTWWIQKSSDGSTWTDLVAASTTNAATKTVTPTADMKLIRAYLGPAGTAPTAANALDIQTVTILADGEKGIDGSGIWTTTTAPTTPNYTFTISNLTGMDRTPMIGDVIVYSYYRYTITSVSDTTVFADPATRTSIRGATGAAAYTVVLSNESHTFAATNTAAVGETLTVNVTAYKGTSSITPTIGTITGQVSGLTTSVSGTTITISATTSLTTQSGILTIPITVDGNVFNKQFSWALAKTGANGQNGTNGTSPTAYNLIVSHAAIVKTKAGTYSPTAITLTAKSQTGNAAMTNYTSGRYAFFLNGSSTAASTVTSTANYSYTIPADTTLVRVVLYSGSSGTTILDEQTVPVVTDGVDGIDGISPYTTYLTNESQVFVYGTAKSIATRLYGYQGTTSKTVTIKTVNGVTAATSNTDTGITGIKFKVSSISAATGPTITFTTTTDLPQSTSGAIPIVFRVTGDSVDRTINFTYSTTTQGQTGAAAVVYEIEPSVYSITKNIDETFTPSTVTFYGYSKTGSNTRAAYSGRWLIQTSEDGSNWTTVYTGTSNASSYTYTPTGSIKLIKAYLGPAGATPTTSNALDSQSVSLLNDNSELELGGRNLLLKTSKDEWSFSTSTTDYYKISNYAKEYIKSGDKLTITFEAKGSVAMWFDMYFRSSSSSYMNGFYPSFQLTTEYQKFEYTKATNRDLTDIVSLRMRQNASSHGTLYIKNLKLEKGNVATDWSAAPEDLKYTQILEYITKNNNSVPSESDSGWGLQVPVSADSYIWQRLKMTYDNGIIEYTVPTCIYTPASQLTSVEEQYFINTSSTTAPSQSSDSWVNKKPEWKDEYYQSKYLWVRTKYTYTGSSPRIDYSTPYYDPTWESISLLNKSIIENAQAVTDAIDNGYVEVKDGQILIQDKDNPQAGGILLSKGGISFRDENGVYTSVWALDGTFDAQSIIVKNLHAEDILSGTLTLKAANDNTNGVFLVQTDGGIEVARIDVNGLKITAVDGSYIYLRTGEDNSSYKGIYLVDANGNTFVSTDTTNGTFIAEKQIINDYQEFNGNIRIIRIGNRGIGFIGI